VPDARITFTVTRTREPNYPPCCDLSIDNAETRTLYGFSCHLAVFAANGDVLYRGPLYVDTPGLIAPPGHSDGGFLNIAVRRPDQIVASDGVCDAWVWGPEGPPP
jgi:hypothetical protein